MAETGSRALSFSLDEESGKLQAGFTPAAGSPSIDAAMLKEALHAAGWGQLALDERAVDEFIVACRKGETPVARVIGVRRDGEFAIALDSDAMTAWLTLVPPQGGRAATAEALDQALAERGIVHGILRPRIEAAFGAGQCERVAIARGMPPTEGAPTRFESLFDRERQPDELGKDAQDHDRIKYTDLCYLQLVRAGDKLMRRHPPVPGRNGTNIKGQPVLPAAVPDLPFRNDLQGAAPDATDRNLLVATSGGQPTALEDGVTVNPVIEVLNVDLSTGSIEFEGTLRVGGDVKAGMHVKVSGDVIVNGAMEAAQIVAGGNVAVRGGIVGHPDSRPGSHSLPPTTARIVCEGTVQAMFMENAHVEAGKSILIARSARQCELIAREEIVVGKGASRAAQGQIIGGRTQATQRVAAGILGGSTGIHTYVQVGSDPYLEKQIADKEADFKHKCDDLDRVIKLLAYFKKNPEKGAGGVAQKVDATRMQVLADIDGLSAELKDMRTQVEMAEQACVEVGSQIPYGVEVRNAQERWPAPAAVGGAGVEPPGPPFAATRQFHHAAATAGPRADHARRAEADHPPAGFQQTVTGRPARG